MADFLFEEAALYGHGVVVTVKEMYGVNRIDEFIKNCNFNGWLVNTIDIRNRIDIHRKINEEIDFE